MRIATYYRISTDDKGQTLETQRHAVGQYLTRSDIPAPVLDFSDSMSGSIFDRPGFQALLAAARAKQFDRLVVFALDRLSRDFMTLMTTLDLLFAAGVAVDTVDGPQDFSSPTAKFLASIKAFIAAEERQKMSERVRAGMARARSQGSVFGAPKGNTRAKGYRKVYPTDLIERIRSFRTSGMTLAQISMATELSVSTVLQIARRNSC